MASDSTQIIQLYENMLVRRLALLRSSAGQLDCSTFSFEQCAEYLDLLMPGSERTLFEQHYPDCVACLYNLVSIIEADRQCESDSRFTEIGQHLSQRKARQHVEETRSKAQPLLLAAAARHRVSRRAAAGIGIDPRSGQGQVLECVAHVYEDSSAAPGLQVIGCQVVEREIDGRRVGVTPPLRMIQDVLSVVCKSNALFKKHRASERSITVQVSHQQESFLSEGLSLSLAAAASVYAALEDIALSDDLVMSGCLEITGRIRKVSHVREKAAVALQQGKTKMILACENMADVEQLDPSVRQSLSFSFVETLPELFECLAELAPSGGKRSESVAEQPAESRGGRVFERLYRLDKYPFSVGIFVAVFCAGFWGNYFIETANSFLGSLAALPAAAVPFVLPLLTVLLFAGCTIIATRPDQHVGFIRRMLFYAMFLLLIPSGIASWKHLNLEPTVVSDPQFEKQAQVSVPALPAPEQSVQEQTEPIESDAPVPEQPLPEEEKTPAFQIDAEDPAAGIEQPSAEKTAPDATDASAPEQQPPEETPTPDLPQDAGFL